MIICHFNDPHLPYAIASLKKQSKKTDIILVDDGFLFRESGTGKTVVKYVSELPQFKQFYKDMKIIEPPQTRGIGYARNIGLNYALKTKYDFVGFLDSDGIAHPLFVEKAVNHLKKHKNLLGVSAKKGIANPDIRIARVKYRYKIYKKDDFELNSSLFRAEACKNRKIPDRIVGEDSVFIRSFSQGELGKLDLPFYHFERETIQSFLRDEFYGAYYSYKTNLTKTVIQFLITPYSSMKIILRKHWILEGLLFPLRQFIWFIGYLLGITFRGEDTHGNKR